MDNNYNEQYLEDYMAREFNEYEEGDILIDGFSELDFINEDFDGGMGQICSWEIDTSECVNRFLDELVGS